MNVAQIEEAIIESENIEKMSYEEQYKRWAENSIPQP